MNIALFVLLLRVVALQLQERLVITSVPVSMAKAKLDGVAFHYWVYGDDNRCHILEEWGYPQQMCCGACSVS